MLLGPRGAGKSTVGPRLAERLRGRFVDSDVELARRFGGGASAGEVLESRGEALFRDLEWRTLAALLVPGPDRPLVVAAGGGAVVSPLTRELVQRRATGVLLLASPEVLAGRCAADPTPRPELRLGERPARADELVRLRMPLYRAASRLSVDTSERTPDEVAELVAIGLHERGAVGR